MRAVRIAAAAAALSSLIAATASAQGLRIAAASDLQAALPVVAERFEKATGQKVSLTFGSSGNFFSQIQNGAPFDLFLSAAIDYPLRPAGPSARVAGRTPRFATVRDRAPRGVHPPRCRHRRSERSVRPHRAQGSQNRDREPRARAVWRGGRGGPSTRGRVRTGAVQAGARREHLAGGAVRPVRQRGGRAPRLVPRAGAGSEECGHLCRNSSGVSSAARAGGGRARGIAAEGARAAISGRAQAAGDRGDPAVVRLRVANRRETALKATAEPAEHAKASKETLRSLRTQRLLFRF